MIKDCLNAAGIVRVVWIDDFFAAPSRDQQVNSIVQCLLNLKDNGRSSAPGFDGIDLSQSVTTVTESVEAFLEEKANSDLSSLLSGIKDILVDAIPSEVSHDDLSIDEFAKLKKAFGNALVTQSLSEWTSSGAEQYSGSDEQTLFLIDKEFTRESPTYDGSILIGDLVKQGRAFCILLTHRCSNADEELQHRNEICKTAGLLFHKFAVLSKRSGDPNEAIQKRFARAFSAVMMHRFTGDLAYSIADAIKNSVDETASKLSRLSVYDLDRAVFVNSSREGVLEFDVLVRIFNSVERGALNKALCVDGLQTRLRRIRGFAKTARGLGIHRPTPDSMKEFRQWRKNEVFEAGLALNVMHAPLVCGDLFEIQNSRKQRFILLGQACDLMIRSKDGERRASLGFLIEVKSVKESKLPGGAGNGSVSTFDLQGVIGADDIWRIDFRSKIIADLNVLDLAVFNVDGSLTLRQPHPDPAMALSEGWERRFTAIKKVFASENGKPKRLPLCVGSFSDDLKCRVRGGVLAYPLVRLGRLEGNTATAILAAWATFETRAALQHDFAAPDKNLVVA